MSVKPKFVQANPFQKAMVNINRIIWLIVLISALFLCGLISTVRAQDYYGQEIVTCPPVFRYEGQRIEFPASFATTGEFVEVPQSRSAILTWCGAEADSLTFNALPHSNLWALYYYQDVPNPQTGEPVNTRVVVKNDHVAAIVDITEAHRVLPELVPSTFIRWINWGGIRPDLSEMPMTVFHGVDDSVRTYVQIPGPEGPIMAVIEFES